MVCSVCTVADRRNCLVTIPPLAKANTRKEANEMIK
jgi:hypothetical protein